MGNTASTRETALNPLSVDRWVDWGGCPWYLRTWIDTAAQIWILPGNPGTLTAPIERTSTCYPCSCDVRDLCSRVFS